MKVRLIEEYDPVTDVTRYEIKRKAGWPAYWYYVYGDRSLEDVRAKFERIKKTKGVLKVIRILAEATL